MMKKIAIFVSLLLFFGITYSQEEPVVTWEGLKKQKEKSDEEIQNDKKKIKVTTWSNRAELYYDIYGFVTKNVYIGMPGTGGVNSVEFLVSKPGKKYTYEEGEVWEYDRMKLYMKNGIVDKIEQTEYIDENAIEKSAEAILKAVEIDEKGKFKEKQSTKDLVQFVKGSIINDAITEYTEKDYKKAYELMSYGHELCKLPKNEVDTIFTLNQIGYFLGVIAYNSEDYENAKKHFKESIDNNYEGGASYHYLADSYAGEGDSAQFIKIVKEGFDNYPEEEQLIIDLINYYMFRNQTDQAVEYIDIAIQNNPENPSYYSAKATIYDNATDALLEKYQEYMDQAYEYKKEAFRERNNPAKLKAAEAKRDEELNKAMAVMEEIETNLNKAEDLYNKSLEIDPKFFNAAYNLGRIYLKRNERNALHADYLLKVYLKKNFEKSAEFENLAKEQLKTAAEKFEIAHTIAPKDRDVLEVLKRIYFRLRDKENEDKVIQKLEALGTDNSNNIK